MTFTLQQLRADTPGCEHRNHLNNAGAALMPSPVVEAITNHIALEAQVGGYEAADVARAEIEQSYALIGRLVGCAASRVAVTASATDAFIRALSSFDFQPGDVLLTSRCDYTSNQIHYLALSKRLGVRVVHAPDLPEGGIDPDAVRLLIHRERPRVVAVSWVPTNSGLVQDVEAVGTFCRNAGVPFIVDACQAVGQIPIDMERLACDYLSATARKFLRGPRGVGFLIASEAALARGDHPLFVDMRGARWVSENRYQVAPTAKRYEDWEFPYALVLGQAAAARYAMDIGIEPAQARAWALADHLRASLARIDGARVLDRGNVRCAIVTVAIDQIDAVSLVQWLTARGINTVVSLREFAIYDFGAKHVEAAIRLSPHYYNTEQEIDSAVESIIEGIAALRRQSVAFPEA